MPPLPPIANKDDVVDDDGNGGECRRRYDVVCCISLDGIVVLFYLVDSSSELFRLGQEMKL